MNRKFVITGSGRSGTNYMAQLLNASGVYCGHEGVFNETEHSGNWADYQADSSWMAVPHLSNLDVPTVLIVRHPMLVVKSYVEIGFFSYHDEMNPCHNVIRKFAPYIYEYKSPADRALAMWLTFNSEALRYAEMVFRIEQFTSSHLTRLLSWAQFDTNKATDAFNSIGVTNRQEDLRAAFKISHTVMWDDMDQDLVRQTEKLGSLLGY